jgi:hypothetical protein
MTIKKHLRGSNYFLASAILVFTATTFSGTSFAMGEQNGQEHTVDGVVGTGANILGDQPYWDFGGPWGVLTFSAVGGFNPDGNDPMPLTQDTPLDTVLVSLVDDKILDEIGYDTAAPQNTPLRQNYTAINGAGDRGELPAVTEVKGYEQSKSLHFQMILLHWVNG